MVRLIIFLLGYSEYIYIYIFQHLYEHLFQVLHDEYMPYELNFFVILKPF